MLRRTYQFSNIGLDMVILYILLANVLFAAALGLIAGYIQEPQPGDAWRRLLVSALIGSGTLVAVLTVVSISASAMVGE